MAIKRHSDLECFYLGLIWKHGPLSVYSIRKSFIDSPSQQWSGSAGAIYPLVQRLEKQELVTSTAVAQGKRKSRNYSITRKGLTVLRAWLAPPFPSDTVSTTYDPLGTRMRFLDALEQPQQVAWFDHAQAALDEVAHRIDVWGLAYTDLYSQLTTVHGKRDIAMRHQWLDDARKSILGSCPAAQAQAQA